MKSSPKKGEKQKRETKGPFCLTNSLRVLALAFMLNLARGVMQDE